MRARQLILATNGYSARQAATISLRQRIIPFRSAIIATAPLSDAVRRRILPNGRVAADTRRLLRWYRMVGDRLVFGGESAALGDEDAHHEAGHQQRQPRPTTPRRQDSPHRDRQQNRNPDAQAHLQRIDQPR